MPITSNDSGLGGHYTSVNIYGYDDYPNGFDCSHPDQWGANSVPECVLFRMLQAPLTDLSRSPWAAHLKYDPNGMNAVYEFQGGAFDGWGGSGYDTCAILTGPDFERG